MDLIDTDMHRRKDHCQSNVAGALPFMEDFLEDCVTTSHNIKEPLPKQCVTNNKKALHENITKIIKDSMRQLLHLTYCKY